MNLLLPERRKTISMKQLKGMIQLLSSGVVIKLAAPKASAKCNITAVEAVKINKQKNLISKSKFYSLCKMSLKF
ncbi:MAG: hypothetical protein K9W45_00025 [Candidatus Heimdallarchaeum aukensis]|uniref:Uncharacterized protein n=1 Tax=Candidatus Heimdallarchaeum aukensis TaxID=2876573 RepID=A0A9Y1FLI9_9ARCH|nr:MAG: hypothetical protein K9W45_00025 [Candidatus Heimdallarchaeum aukensis]